MAVARITAQHRREHMIPIEQVLEIALSAQGVPYRMGAVAQASEVRPSELDCSELVKWACARAKVVPRMPDGSWYQLQHCLRHATKIEVDEALRTRGALLFYFDGNPLGTTRPKGAHVAFSLGDGRTFEAKSTRLGTGTFKTSMVRWTHGGLIPGCVYAGVAAQARA
jgi:cell wall-associated NlpC family hydrolase